LLVADHATAYNKMCKTCIEWKRELIQVITWHEKMEEVIKSMENLGQSKVK